MRSRKGDGSGGCGGGCGAVGYAVKRFVMVRQSLGLELELLLDFFLLLVTGAAIPSAFAFASQSGRDECDAETQSLKMVQALAIESDPAAEKSRLLLNGLVETMPGLRHYTKDGNWDGTRPPISCLQRHDACTDNSATCTDHICCISSNYHHDCVQ
ncbi:Uncharacterized protein HZ326_23669 [Fusarium oxysporum f. sp. albedinis]|nr:Uncharacterized protein HZ326_23669 [Fusarium oxysporum f. sp. albedinis]